MATYLKELKTWCNKVALFLSKQQQKIKVTSWKQKCYFSYLCIVWVLQGESLWNCLVRLNQHISIESLTWWILSVQIVVKGNMLLYAHFIIFFIVITCLCHDGRGLTLLAWKKCLCNAIVFKSVFIELNYRENKKECALFLHIPKLFVIRVFKYSKIVSDIYS